jgi:hypothetical protein
MSQAEPSAVVLWGYREQSPRCFDSQALDGTGGGDARGLRVVAAETAVTHSGLSGQCRKRQRHGKETDTAG